MKCWQAPGVRLVQKRGFLGVRLLPVARDDDLAPVGEPEAGDVDRIAERMFRQLRACDIVDRAAAIGAEHVEPDDPLAEPRLRDRLHDLVQPGLDRRDHRTIYRERLVER